MAQLPAACPARLAERWLWRAASAFDSIPEGFAGVEQSIDERGAAPAPNWACRALLAPAELIWPAPQVLPSQAATALREALRVAVAVRAALLTLPPAPGDARNRTWAVLALLRYDAEAAGVALALRCGAQGLASPIEAAELLDSLHSSAIGACLDLTGATVTSAEDWVEVLGRRMVCVRMLERVPQRLLDMLSERGFAGWCVCAADPAGANEISRQGGGA